MTTEDMNAQFYVAPWGRRFAVLNVLFTRGEPLVVCDSEIDAIAQAAKRNHKRTKKAS